MQNGVWSQFFNNQSLLLQNVETKVNRLVSRVKQVVLGKLMVAQ